LESELREDMVARFDGIPGSKKFVVCFGSGRVQGQGPVGFISAREPGKRKEK
jgi:hypothetical protein